MDIPAGWNKRLADLEPSDHGDGRPSITGEEFEWAREYERRLLRPWARFPRDGEVYEALDDVAVSFLTHWRAPFRAAVVASYRAERVCVFTCMTLRQWGSLPR